MWVNVDVVKLAALVKINFFILYITKGERLKRKFLCMSANHISASLFVWTVHLENCCDFITISDRVSKKRTKTHFCRILRIFSMKRAIKISLNFTLFKFWTTFWQSFATVVINLFPTDCRDFLTLATYKLETSIFYVNIVVFIFL